MKTLWIGFGGAIGTMLRYQIDGWVQRKLGTGFPYGILSINLIGSFLISLLMNVGLRTETFSPVARIALTTGVLGGFTTYSTFNYEVLAYFREGAWWIGATYMLATVFGCLAAGLMGWAIGRALSGG